MTSGQKGICVVKQKRTLARNEDNALFGGVCAGIADYVDMDSILIRVAAIILGIFTLGIAVIPYVIMWAVLPSYAAPRDSLVDVDPLDVQSDKYTHVVNTPAQSSAQAQHGVFAGAGHVPPQPPLNVQTSSTPGVAAPTPIKEDSAKQKQHPVLIAFFLAILLILLFSMFANNMVGRVPDLELIQFIPIAFVVLGIVVLVVPLHRWALPIRVCGFILCIELCLYFLGFTLLEIPFDVLGKTGPVPNLLWLASLFVFFAALVCKEDTLFVVTVVLTGIACLCTLGEIHFFSYLLGEAPYSHHNFLFPPIEAS